MTQEPSVSWKVYVDTRFDAADKAVGAALASAEKAVSAALSAAKEAVTKAETASGARFEDSNHIRGAMLDAQKQFATLEKVDGLAQQIADIKLQLMAQEGTKRGVASVGTVIGWILGAVGSLFGIAGGVAWAFTVMGK